MLNNQEISELVFIKDLGMMYPNEKSKQKRRYGLYKCKCGKEFKSQFYAVKKGKTKSCGCLHIESITKHSNSGHKIFIAWDHMVQRCNNKNNKQFHYYGGRGITVCERWLISKNFIDDMLPTWQEGLELDRIDNNGNYEPSNCRWVSRTIQNRNTRRLRSNNTSGYRGVSFHKLSNKFVSQIVVDNQNNYLGLFNTSFEAAKAYDSYIVEHNLEHTKNEVL